MHTPTPTPPEGFDILVRRRDGPPIECQVRNREDLEVYIAAVVPGGPGAQRLEDRHGNGYVVALAVVTALEWRQPDDPAGVPADAA
jgi:hypothetical protein